MRDRSFDICKGLGILSVYLVHSIIYHPIALEDIYPWCYWLKYSFASFFMPMFFIISGYLLTQTHKSTTELYKSKTLRLLVPYLITMAIIIVSKLLLPKTMAYNTNDGILSLLYNTIFEGGDRWFVYTLFIIFLLVIPFRKVLIEKKWICLLLITASMAFFLVDILPKFLALKTMAHYLPFFLLGICLYNVFPNLKVWAIKRWWLIYIIFIVGNFVIAVPLKKITLVYRFILPITGSLGLLTMAFRLEKNNNKLSQYIAYLGKYSLQFYLFTFCYPLIRTLIVSIMHISNPIVIVSSVFVLQLITSTVIVEITRRIKCLKILCGY